MNIDNGRLYQLFRKNGCFINILFGLFYLVSIFIWYPYGLLFGIAVFFLRNKYNPWYFIFPKFFEYTFITVYIFCFTFFMEGYKYTFIIGLAFFFLKKYLDSEDRKTEEKTKRQKEREQKAFEKLPIWKQEDFPSEETYITVKKLQLDEEMAKNELELQKRERIELLAKSYKRRHATSSFKNNLSKIDDLMNLTPIEFEKWVKKYIFEKDGWEVSETKVTGDGGIDLIISKKGERSIAQCKRYRQTVGEPMLRDFYGTMMSEGVSRGYFVTTGLFSLAALKFADNKPIEMIDRRVLAEKIGERLSKNRTYYNVYREKYER